MILDRFVHRCHSSPSIRRFRFFALSSFAVLFLYTVRNYVLPRRGIQGIQDGVLICLLCRCLLFTVRNPFDE